MLSYLVRCPARRIPDSGALQRTDVMRGCNQVSGLPLSKPAGGYSLR
jgi:hypothetical protein